MKNRNRLFIATLIVVVIGLAIYVWLKPRPSVPALAETTQSVSTPQPSPAPTAAASPTLIGGRPAPVHPELAKPGVREKNEPDRGKIAEYLSMFMTPISFYGRAMDEKGNPVPGASITYQAANQPDPNASNPKYPGTSDNEGYFSITGLHGASLYIDVSKEGYYRTPPFDGHRGSYDGFAYAGVLSKDDVPPPTKDNPAIFVLRKQGEGIALAHWGREISIGKNGESQVVSLQTGHSTPQGELAVQCWTEDQKKDARGHYPWQCQVSVVGGGLIKREGQFDFEAPTEGYQPTDEIAPPQDRWSPQGKRQYFVKTADGHYARVTVDMVAGGDHFMTIECYYNPTPGSRNLEPASNQQTAGQ